MGAVAIGAKDFKETIEKGGTVLVDWWAPWCGPCRSFAPTYEAVAEANPDLVFAKVNTEEERELAGAFAIQSIPTLMIFRDQILLFAQPGAVPRPALEDLVQKVRALDMDQVRKEIAEHEAQGGEPGSGPPPAP